MAFSSNQVWFRLHWLAGISAGVVLAVVGFTGAMIGCEEPLLRALNPEYRITPAPNTTPLPPSALVGIAASAHPDLSVRAFLWHGDDTPVAVRLARAGALRGGTRVAVDPYSGKLMRPERGRDFLEFSEQLHRRLAAGDIGRRIVGISTALLILMSITGLILRWPRRPHRLRFWLKPDFSMRGRGLLRNLHSVAGTWVLVLFLLASLTGLWWSWDFYRDALNHWAGISGPLRRPPLSAGNSDKPLVSPDIAWTAFRTAVPNATEATLTLTHAKHEPVQVRYLTTASPHERAFDTMRISAATGQLISREAYADQPRGRRFIASLFPLHSGSFFGAPGRWLMAFASLLMPLFALSGIWLWFWRRRNAARSKRALPNAVLEATH